MRLEIDRKYVKFPKDSPYSDLEAYISLLLDLESIRMDHARILTMNDILSVSFADAKGKGIKPPSNRGKISIRGYRTLWRWGQKRIERFIFPIIENWLRVQETSALSPWKPLGKPVKPSAVSGCSEENVSFSHEGKSQASAVNECNIGIDIVGENAKSECSERVTTIKNNKNLSNLEDKNQIHMHENNKLVSPMHDYQEFDMEAENEPLNELDWKNAGHSESMLVTIESPVLTDARIINGYLKEYWGMPTTRPAADLMIKYRMTEDMLRTVANYAYTSGWDQFKTLNLHSAIAALNMTIQI